MGTGRSQASTGRSQRDKYADFAARMDQALSPSLAPNPSPILNLVLTRTRTRTRTLTLTLILD